MAQEKDRETVAQEKDLGKVAQEKDLGKVIAVNTKLLMDNNFSDENFFDSLFLDICFSILVCVTGPIGLCPVSAPNCGNTNEPKAIPGSPCTTPCSEFATGADWCCVEKSGCPDPNAPSEHWGWCIDQTALCKGISFSY